MNGHINDTVIEKVSFGSNIEYINGKKPIQYLFKTLYYNYPIHHLLINRSSLIQSNQ